MLENLSTQTLVITGVFSFFMILFSYRDYSSYETDTHKDYKSIIVSMGVLGTFVGIFIGLMDFDTTNIKGSVPILLDGLKTAFITSIEGMFLSIVLSALQKSTGHGEIEDELQLLNSINTKLENLGILSNIDDKLKNVEILPLINTKLDSMDTNIKVLSQDISSVKEEMRSSQKILFDFLDESMNKVIRALDEAIEVLAKGATEEIIKALETVIQDFNKNLTDQFGDNFKQLNEAVKNMIDWQNNYKMSIEKTEENLKALITTVESSSVQLENISSSTTTMTDNYAKIGTTSENLQKIIEVNDNQINNLESHLKSLAEVGEKAKLSVTSIDEFSDKIQTSVSAQSEALNQLTQEINKQLPDSLDELNKALTSLTNKFKEDYEFFLEQVSKLMVSSNRA